MYAEKEKTKTAYTETYELADIGQRFIALIIDGLILGFVTGLLFGIGREPGGLVSFIVGVAYNWYFWTRNNGQTPGKSVMGIRVIKADGSLISDGDAVMRYIGYYISSLVFGLGWLWAFFDGRNQTWHDKLANTYVVKA